MSRVNNWEIPSTSLTEAGDVFLEDHLEDMNGDRKRVNLDFLSKTHDLYIRDDLIRVPAFRLGLVSVTHLQNDQVVRFVGDNRFSKNQKGVAVGVATYFATLGGIDYLCSDWGFLLGNLAPFVSAMPAFFTGLVLSNSAPRQFKRYRALEDLRTNSFTNFPQEINRKLLKNVGAYVPSKKNRHLLGNYITVEHPDLVIPSDAIPKLGVNWDFGDKIRFFVSEAPKESISLVSYDLSGISTLLVGGKRSEPSRATSLILEYSESNKTVSLLNTFHPSAAQQRFR